MSRVNKPMHISVPISKVDEEQRMVWGFATVEEVDKHGEIIGYEASKKAFGAWPGNIREQHNPDRAVGKGIEVQFDDAKKGVWLGAYVSESADGENAWIKVKEGILQGFSIGGRINQWDTVKVDGNDHLMVTDYDLSEVSLVDNPACPSAMLEMVKSVDGHLDRTEKLRKMDGRKPMWFEKAFKFAPNHKVIAKLNSTYNKDSMANKSDTVEKSIWSGGMLVDLGRQLADYVWMENFNGKDVTNLENALEEIKAAASQELTEPEKWPEPMADAIELAMQTLNLTKENLEEKAMAKNEKTTQKDVTGDETRDVNAEVVTTAEENGRPADDTADRAAAVATDEDAKVDEKVEETDTVDEEVTEDDAQDTEDKGKKGKKSDDAQDIQKSTNNNDLLKSVGDIVAKSVKEAVAPLEERLGKLEKMPADSKVKAEYADVEKSESKQDNADQNRMSEIMAKAEEMAANPGAYTVQQRMQLAKEMRKLQRANDPASVAQIAQLKASIR